MENNYGKLNNQGNQTRPTTTKHGQVYQATHIGERSLPYMERSFISFTYGGKKIEDFDLISTISGSRLDRAGYASFNDIVTSYDILDGQHYWSTHYKTNQLDFTLSTDGIDQRTLDEFLHWFQAGIARELILAEHPNRAIMARVAEPPVLNLLPFEQDVEVKISNNSYKTKTTLYKGDITLSLIMDSPHWYAIVNILGKKVNTNGVEHYVDYWDDPFTGEQDVSIFASQDALKILYEDGIPLGSMIDTSMLLGNGAYANVENSDTSLIWDPISETGALIDDGTGEYGVIAGAIVDANDQGISSLPKDTPGYFFYAGTAPAYTQITFTLTPMLISHMVSVPYNEYNGIGQRYNTITIESENTQTFRFTTPNLYTSYNKAMDIFNHRVNSSYTWEQIREELRDNVRHPYVRAWAVSVIEYAQLVSNSDHANNIYLANIQQSMHYFLTIPSSTNPNTVPPATFTFNSETGAAIGKFKYRKISQLPSIGSGNTWNLTDEGGWGSAHDGEYVEIEEDVGDMLRSNYIIIQDRNYPTVDGKIVGWQNTPQGRTYSHRILHDVDTPLTNLSILYKNMYL